MTPLTFGPTDYKQNKLKNILLFIHKTERERGNSPLLFISF